jgi:signal transduction histidine kinase
MTVSQRMSETDYTGPFPPVDTMAMIPVILRLVKQTTGLRFSAVARVTADQWVAYAVDDSVRLDIRPGDERVVHETLCNEVRLRRRSLACGAGMRELANGPYEPENHIPRDRLQSHISVPIITSTGLFVGTLCGLDPEPQNFNDTSVIETLELFAQLLASHLELHTQLNDSQSELGVAEETGRLREEFVAVLGHDLRTPISAVRLSAELLQARVEEQHSRKLVDAIHSSTLRMSALIEDVLDFTRCRLGAKFVINLSRVDNLFEALTPVIAEIRHAHPGADVVYRFGAARPVRCDFGRISQLVSNLLSNAVHHGAPGGPILINGHVDDQSMVLSFSNEGAAIHADQIDLLFKPFTRAEGENKSAGLGLGLYICSQIAESHGGELHVTSDDRHTVFTVRLPLLVESVEPMPA